ncbi:uncharacterized protein LOC110503063 [Oncorhynchus mykiss]|uniref:uncharacterized protein LOC110503063 n=1 Tax=Oncorhynchus mykiss TaxID=8022 RepID=UPI0018780598|nr:uncharacterized protein LOC110503063 [Oncorhynchus mykiss]
MKACHPAKAEARSSTTCTISSPIMELGKHMWTLIVIIAVAKTRTSLCSGIVPGGPCLSSTTVWTFTYLITGHTRFAWCFGLIKQRFRKTRVNTLSEIAGVVKDSTVTGVNTPQLVGLEDGTVLVENYGWQQHLTPYFRPLPLFKQYQHISFNALEPGVVVAKERSDSVRTRFQLLRKADILPPIDGLPVQAPPGQDTARQTYVFEKIMEFSKRSWTSHALHQSQGQDRNRLSEYRFPCSCMVQMDQSSAQSTVPLFK